MKKCGLVNCSNEAAPRQKYCCREHAPYGKMKYETPGRKPRKDMKPSKQLTLVNSSTFSE